MDKLGKYTTFEELAAYARHRAVKSAGQGGHQEFSYWLATATWARDMLRVYGPHDDAQLLEEFDQLVQGTTIHAARGNYHHAATSYARAVHVRKMLRWRGCKVSRLSLGWLRNAASQIANDFV